MTAVAQSHANIVIVIIASRRHRCTSFSALPDRATAHTGEWMSWQHPSPDDECNDDRPPDRHCHSPSDHHSTHRWCHCCARRCCRSSSLSSSSTPPSRRQKNVHRRRRPHPLLIRRRCHRHRCHRSPRCGRRRLSWSTGAIASRPGSNSTIPVRALPSKSMTWMGTDDQGAEEVLMGSAPFVPRITTA